jgi:hypothetical protein
MQEAHMAEQLPIIRTTQNAIATEKKSNTLLGRGLAAIQSQQLAIIEQDKRYREARDIYNRIIKNNWYFPEDDDYWTTEKENQLRSCLTTFCS